MRPSLTERPLAHGRLPVGNRRHGRLGSLRYFSRTDAPPAWATGTNVAQTALSAVSPTAQSAERTLRGRASLPYPTPPRARTPCRVCNRRYGRLGSLRYILRTDAPSRLGNRRQRSADSLVCCIADYPVGCAHLRGRASLPYPPASRAATPCRLGNRRYGRRCSLHCTLREHYSASPLSSGAPTPAIPSSVGGAYYARLGLDARPGRALAGSGHPEAGATKLAPCPIGSILGTCQPGGAWGFLHRSRSSESRGGWVARLPR